MAHSRCSGGLRNNQMRFSGSPVGLSLCIFPPDSYPISPCAQVLTAGPSSSSQSAGPAPASASSQPVGILLFNAASQAPGQGPLCGEGACSARAYTHWPIGGATREAWESLLAPSAYRGKPAWSRQHDYVLIKRQWGVGCHPHIQPVHPSTMLPGPGRP